MCSVGRAQEDWIEWLERQSIWEPIVCPFGHLKYLSSSCTFLHLKLLVESRGGLCCVSLVSAWYWVLTIPVTNQIMSTHFYPGNVSWLVKLAPGPQISWHQHPSHHHHHHHHHRQHHLDINQNISTISLLTISLLSNRFYFFLSQLVISTTTTMSLSDNDLIRAFSSPFVLVRNKSYCWY